MNSGTLKKLRFFNSGSDNCDVGGDAIREAFRQLRVNQNVHNAEALCNAFSLSQKTIRQYLEENQFKAFLNSNFFHENYHRESQLPAIAEDTIAVHRVSIYTHTPFS